MHRQFFFLVPLICLSSALWAAPATVNVEVLQDKLDHPWALAFLPDNHGMLITLRGGECNFAFFSGLIGAQFWAERVQPKSPELDAKLLVSC